MTEVKTEVEFKFDKVDYIVKLPSLEDIKQATRVYNETFREAIEAKAPVRASIDKIMREQGLWNEEKDRQDKTLVKEIADLEYKLSKGGIRKALGKQISLKIRKLRQDLSDLRMVKADLASSTAEGQAENMKFNYLVSVCLVYKDSGERYYNSLNDFLNSVYEPLAQETIQRYLNLAMPGVSTPDAELPENKFLVRFGYVNSDLRLVDDNGRLVDEDGNLIDKDGNYVNEKGERVDINGHRLDKNGNFIVEEQPFLDDEDNPIEEVKKTTKRTVKT